MARNSRGRPKTHKQPITVHLPVLLISELKQKHPELLKPLSDPPEFRHGAFGSWLEKVLWRELRKEGKKPTPPILGEQTNDKG